MKIFLEKLNEQQREAVLEKSSHVCVIAGAGCGKTTTLIYRICFLLSVKKVKAENILILTFAKKAMREIVERVSNVLGAEGANLYIYNFHSFCFSVLLKHSKLLGYLNNNLVVYDADDQQTVIKEFVLFDKKNKEEAIETVLLINNIKNQKKNDADISKAERVLFESYQNCLRENKAIDFNDLIILTIRLFVNFPEICENYRNKFSYILIDESQDLNEIQWEIIRLLNGKKQNIFVVGDPNQAIYGFQGARPETLSSIANSRIWKTIYLNINYRSTDNILHLSNSFIKSNKELIQNKLEGVCQQINSKVTRVSRIWPASLAKLIFAIKIKKRLNWGDIAVLYRSNFLSSPIERGLKKQKIPYEVLGAYSFLRREEVKDMISLLRSIINKDDVSLVNTLAWQEKIGRITIGKIIGLSKEKQISVFDCLLDLKDVSLFNANQKKRLSEFSRKLYNWNRAFFELFADKIENYFWEILRDLAYLKHLRKRKDYLKRYSNIQQLINLIVNWNVEEYSILAKKNCIDFLGGFLQWLSIFFEKKESFTKKK